MIPTPHINIINKEDVAETVLMPGDPKRAEYIAKKYLRTPHYCLELVKSAIPKYKRKKIKKIIKKKKK